MLTYDRYLMASSLGEAFDALQAVDGARLLAGATDLLPWAREGRAGDVHLPALVDVSRLAELQGIRQEGDRLVMGACTPIIAFEEHPLLQRHAPVLARCAVWFADAQLRAQATVGGNLVNASPAGDTLPALLAMNTQLTLARRDADGVIRERVVPLSDFITGPGRTACQPQEIVLRLECDALPEHGVAFEKVGHRRSLVISTVCLAALVKLDWTHRHIADARLAIGAVGPVPERLADVEDALLGQTPTPALLRSVAVKVADRVRSRSRQAYRREVLVHFVERGLQAALQDAGVSVERLPKELSHV